MSELTLGESRVRTDFNPSKTGYVDQIKQKSAELINLVNDAANDPSWDDKKLYEWTRLKKNALNAYEEAAMWAVKAATI